MSLLPLGGTAVQLKQRPPSASSTSRPSRVFCSLPLQQTTHLPVHLNGHFALSSEMRKSLCEDDDGSCRAAWNRLLLEHVVAPSYVSLLRALRFEYLRYRSHEGEGEEAVVQAPRPVLESLLRPYERYFPLFHAAGCHLDQLVTNVYRHLASSGAPVFPCLRERAPAAAAADGAEPRFHVQWLPAAGRGPLKAFFPTKDRCSEPKKKTVSPLGVLKSWTTGLFGSRRSDAAERTEASDEDVLQQVLLHSGFKLLHTPAVLVRTFQQAGVDDIDVMSPQGVLKFFKTFSEAEGCCDVGEVPCHLKDTVFRELSVLKVVLRYCRGALADDDDPASSADERQAQVLFAQALEGTPLLLTEDETVRVFDGSSAVFLSEYSELLAGHGGDAFLHGSLRKEFFSHCDVDGSGVFRAFGLEDLAAMLHLVLDADTLLASEDSSDVIVEWSTGPNYPKDQWLKRLWTFVRHELRDSVTSTALEPEERVAVIEERLAPLRRWCLLPVSGGSRGQRQLGPISSAGSVVYWDVADGVDAGLRPVLQRLGVGELRVADVESSGTARHPNLDVLRQLVATSQRPLSVLRLLHALPPDRFRLSDVDAGTLLLFLSDNLQALRDDDDDDAVTMLLDLPLYKTVYGDLISVTDCCVYTIPAKIPTNGVEVWKSKHDTVFLERDDRLASLYDALGCQPISAVHVYRDFIFQHFEYFDAPDRAVHVQHVYDSYLRHDGGSGVSAQDAADFRQAVLQLPFVEDQDGDLQPASAFYDPENRVFHALLTPDSFPPAHMKYFQQEQWYTLLRALGLKQDVTTELFVEFVKRVAAQTDSDEGDNSATAKAKVPVHAHVNGQQYTITTEYRRSMLTALIFEALRNRILVHVHTQVYLCSCLWVKTK